MSHYSAVSRQYASVASNCTYSKLLHTRPRDCVLTAVLLMTHWPFNTCLMLPTLEHEISTLEINNQYRAKNNNTKSRWNLVRVNNSNGVRQRMRKMGPTNTQAILADFKKDHDTSSKFCSYSWRISVRILCKKESKSKSNNIQWSQGD